MISERPLMAKYVPESGESSGAGRIHDRVCYTHEGTPLVLREPGGSEEIRTAGEVENMEDIIREAYPEDAESVFAEFERIVTERDAFDPYGNIGESSPEPGFGNEEGAGDRSDGIRKFLDRHPKLGRSAKALLLTLTLASPVAGSKSAEAWVPVESCSGLMGKGFDTPPRNAVDIVMYDMTNFADAYRDAQWRAQEWMRRKDMAAENIAMAVDAMTIAELAFQRELPALERKYGARLADIRATYADRIALEADRSGKEALKVRWEQEMYSERGRAADAITRMETDLRNLKLSMMENMDRQSLYSGSRRLYELVATFEKKMARLEELNASMANKSRQHLYDELSRYGLSARETDSVLPPVAFPRSYDSGNVRTEATESAGREHVTESDYRLFESVRGR